MTTLTFQTPDDFGAYLRQQGDHYVAPNKTFHHHTLPSGRNVYWSNMYGHVSRDYKTIAGLCRYHDMTFPLEIDAS